MLAFSRAAALCAGLSDDPAPLALLPEPWASEARRGAERLRSLDRVGRAAALARESVACFHAPALAGARRPLPRGLTLALAEPESVEPSALDDWTLRALGALEALGVHTLARSALPGGAAALAEVARGLGGEELELLLRGCRSRVQPADPEAIACSTLLVHLATGDARVPGLPRRVGVMRLGWALADDPAAQAAAAATLSPAEAAGFQEAAESGCLFAEHAAAERLRLRQDLEDLGGSRDPGD